MLSSVGRLSAVAALILLLGGGGPAHGEAMLELFNVRWVDVTQKIPEIAEAGYDSLWLPNPAKGGSGTYSVGYDEFDPFDLGNKYQCGTVATRWGTKDELVAMVRMAHRFGLRVYFDNVMNHRAFAVPGFNSSTPTNYYPGLVPQDFHLQTVAGGYYANWPQIQNYCYQQEVQNQPLLGLVDLANEPGSLNYNFGPTLGSTTTKPRFIRQPNDPEYYMDTNGVSLGGNWHPFDGNGQPVPEYVEQYLTRAAMWTLYTTRCDGFRLDAVKHVPSNFFGANTGSGTFVNDPSFSGYTGGIQAMYDYVHGYGSNVDGNGYLETDGNRNSLFDMEAPRNDAMLFGEHISPVPDFQQYLAVGMRLCNQPLYNQLNNVLSGNAGFYGMDSTNYTPAPDYCNGTAYPCYVSSQSVMFPQTQDGSSCCPVHQELQDAYIFMTEGLPMVYSDGFNHSGPPDYFPIVSYASYLGETNFLAQSHDEASDDRIPDIVYLHNQLARGGTASRWSDQNIVAFERYDYRESSNPPDETVALFALNDKTYPGDITFDDGIARTSDGYYGGIPVSNTRGQGLVVGFPPGSVLAQLSSTATGRDRAYSKLLVHGATNVRSLAEASANDPNPANRLIYVGGQTLAPGGGAIELNIPSGSSDPTYPYGGWVIYGYQWPEPSRANPATDAIILRQGGADAPHITVYRQDGANGDPNFNPLYPFKMRGSVDPYGNVITGVNVSNRTYAIDVPVVTNGWFDILVRCDASSVNALVKLDGGIDLNSQMGLGPASGGVGPAGPDLRDNKPGYATDVFLGYEQTAFQFRNGPEKFAARNTGSNTVVSLGAETYFYVVGAGSSVVAGSGYGAAITNQTAAWVLHDPTSAVTALSTNLPSQRYPLNPTSSQNVQVWVKVGYQSQVNTGYIYYTTDGSDPDGAFGIGKGTTQVAPLHLDSQDSATNNVAWWMGTLPAQSNNQQVRYKVGLFNGGSAQAGQSIQPISDAEPSGSKLYGLTRAAITNFNPTTAVVWLDDDLNTNNTTIGLQPGFHIIRARVFLPRSGKSSVFNTFSQTFYYDAGLPTGAIVTPVADGTSLSNSSYTVVVRADSSVVGVDFNIQDSNPANDDSATGQPNGNGDTNGVPVFVSATPVTPDPNLTAQYPDYPLEFRFTYQAVPNSGTATISVHLKEYSTSIYPSRFTSLTRTVNTVAPTQVVEISNPAADGSIITLAPGDYYPIQTCFTGTLDTNIIDWFSIYINGVLQPRRDPSTFVPYYYITGTGCGTGMRMLSYNWFDAQPGTNVIQVVFSHNVTLSDTRTVIVAPPLYISKLSNNNQLIIWDSAPGVNYQVLAATNLSQPFLPISPVIQGAGSSTFYFDNSPSVPIKFYRIQVVP